MIFLVTILYTNGYDKTIQMDMRRLWWNSTNWSDKL